MSRPGVNYSPRFDTTPGTERTALGAVYAHVLRCHEAKKQAAAGSNSGDGHDAMEGSKKNDRAEPKYT